MVRLSQCRSLGPSYSISAEKTGKLLPANPARRIEAIQWVFFQMAGIGPMFAQFGFFHKFAGRDYPDKRPFERYRAEAERLLKVLNTRLESRSWIMGEEYSIADIALLSWVRHFVTFYDAGALVGFASLVHVAAWLDRALGRPAVQRGLTIPARS